VPKDETFEFYKKVLELKDVDAARKFFRTTQLTELPQFALDLAPETSEEEYGIVQVDADCQIEGRQPPERKPNKRKANRDAAQVDADPEQRPQRPRTETWKHKQVHHGKFVLRFSGMLIIAIYIYICMYVYIYIYISRFRMG